MVKQYTFKTTKATEWMEPILDRLAENGDRSAILREMVEHYLECTGIKFQEVTIQRNVVFRSATPQHQIPPHNIPSGHTPQHHTTPDNTTSANITQDVTTPDNTTPDVTESDEPVFKVKKVDLGSKLEDLV